MWLIKVHMYKSGSWHIGSACGLGASPTPDLREPARAVPHNGGQGWPPEKQRQRHGGVVSSLDTSCV
jgi:hypothetical protein